MTLKAGIIIMFCFKLDFIDFSCNFLIAFYACSSTQIGSIVLSSVVTSSFQSGSLPATLNITTTEVHRYCTRRWNSNKGFGGGGGGGGV